MGNSAKHILLCAALGVLGFLAGKVTTHRASVTEPNSAANPADVAHPKPLSAVPRATALANVRRLATDGTDPVALWEALQLLGVDDLSKALDHATKTDVTSGFVIAMRWLELDPDGLREHLIYTPRAGGVMLRPAVLVQWSRIDPQAAYDASLAMPHNVMKPWQTEAVVKDLILRDDPSLGSILGQLPPRHSVLHKIAATVRSARSDPLSTIDALGSSPEKHSLVDIPLLAAIDGGQIAEAAARLTAAPWAMTELPIEVRFSWKHRSPETLAAWEERHGERRPPIDLLTAKARATELLQAKSSSASE